MSSYKVISEVSKVLRQILWAEFSADPVVSDIIRAPQEIVFKNPTETAADTANRLSVWLHQVTENEFVKNQPMVRANGPESARFPPLALNLYYLVTPFAPSHNPESEQLLLGKTMQVLYDNAIVVLLDQTPGEEVAEELRIILARLSLEELTRIWEALQAPYRLSVCYQVRVTSIESDRVPGGARIVERIAGYGAKPVEPKE